MKLFALIMIIWVLITNGEQCGLPAPDLEHTHSFGEWTTVKEATETEDGLKERYCDCGEKETQDINFEAQ